MNLGQRIAAWRRAKGWYQLQLAERAGLSRAYISMLETDEKQNPSKDVLDKIVDALGVSLARFYGRVPAAKRGFVDRAKRAAA
jgi:transcriptional regulator with XRE-family HTH domain